MYKLYINKEIESSIIDFAEKNLMTPTDAAGYLLSYAVKMLEDTGSTSIADLLKHTQVSSTQQSKIYTKNLLDLESSEDLLEISKDLDDIFEELPVCDNYLQKSLPVVYLARRPEDNAVKIGRTTRLINSDLSVLKNGNRLSQLKTGSSGGTSNTYIFAFFYPESFFKDESKNFSKSIQKTIDLEGYLLRFYKKTPDTSDFGGMEWRCFDKNLSDKFIFNTIENTINKSIFNYQFKGVLKNIR